MWSQPQDKISHNDKLVSPLGDDEEIGWECKCSNILSGPVLIGRGLDQEKKEEVSCSFYIMYFWVCWKDILNNIGNEDEGGTPVTMPNTEVKPLDAEDT